LLDEYLGKKLLLQSFIPGSMQVAHDYGLSFHEQNGKEKEVEKRGYRNVSLYEKTAEEDSPADKNRMWDC